MFMSTVHLQNEKGIMHELFLLLLLCLFVFATLSNGDDRKAAFFKEISQGASLEDGTMTNMNHKSFYQCSIERKCSFVIKNLKENEIKKIYNEKDLPKDRKGFRVWQKQVINNESIEESLTLENGKIAPNLTALSNGKPTNQSTNLGASYSSFGVDSNNLTCFHTAQYVNRAWWMVDLLHESNVIEVAITTNRVIEGFDHMLRDVDIRVGKHNMNHTNPFCFEHASHTVPTSTAIIRCKNTVRGRYVFIETNMKDEALTICEVVVYGYHNDFD